MELSKIIPTKQIFSQQRMSSANWLLRRVSSLPVLYCRRGAARLGLLSWRPLPPTKTRKFAPELPREDFVKAAEEFFCLSYLGFIQNILGRIRTMTMAVICLFLGATLSVASYPFDPRPVTSGIFVFVFVMVAVVIIFVYGQMHRDVTLSHITNTSPGELGLDFWIKLFTFGVGPLLALITALFPYLAGVVTSWLQPAVSNMK